MVEYKYMKEKFDINSFQKLEKMERIERNENIDQLATIIRIVSGNPSLKVTTKVPELNRRSLEARGKNPDNTWFYLEGRKTPHGKLEEFCRKGKSRKQPYSFTRRNFTAFLEALDNWSEVDPITGEEVSFMRKTRSWRGRPGGFIDKSLLKSAVADLFEVYYLNQIAVDDRETVYNLLDLNGLKGADPFKKVRASK